MVISSYRPQVITTRMVEIPATVQGILSWQMSLEALLQLIESKASLLQQPRASQAQHRHKHRSQPTSKLWLGNCSSSLHHHSWYGVGQAQAVHLPPSSMGGEVFAPSSAPTSLLPGTVLAQTPSGLTVAVVDGAIQLSHFVTPQGQEVDATALPITVGQRLPCLPLGQQRAIAQLEAQTAVHESTWQRRLANLRAAQLPYGSGAPGPGSIFAQAPIDLEPILSQASPEFSQVLAQLGGTALLTTFLVFLSSFSQETARSILPIGTSPQQRPLGDLSLDHLGLRTSNLHQALNSDVLTALFTGHVPARFNLDLRQPLAPNLERVMMELEFLETALTYRQDLTLAVDPTTLPSAYPILIELVETLSDAPQALGQALTLQFAEFGQACHWFYNPAVLTEEEVELMQRRFLTLLATITQNPEQPLLQQLEPLFA